MTRRIALFRGINVGGKNAVSMKNLTGILERLGCRNVRAYGACKTPGLRLGTGLYPGEHRCPGDCVQLVPADRRQSQRGGNRRFRRAFQRVWGHGGWLTGTGMGWGWPAARWLCHQRSWSAVSRARPNSSGSRPGCPDGRSSLSRPLTRSPACVRCPNLIGTESRRRGIRFVAPRALSPRGLTACRRQLRVVGRIHPGRTDWSSARRTGSPGQSGRPSRERGRQRQLGNRSATSRCSL